MLMVSMNEYFLIDIIFQWIVKMKPKVSEEKN